MDNIVIQVLCTLGIPSAITGLGIYLLKQRMKRNEEKLRERENNLESLVLMMMQSTRANSVGIQAIARAIQRIPDAKCNGDMEAALEKMAAIQKEEQTFLVNKGVKYIFE